MKNIRTSLLTEIKEIENLSSVGNILVYTDFDDVVSPMISYDQPMAAFAAINWYDGYQGMSVEFAKI